MKSEREKKKRKTNKENYVIKLKGYMRNTKDDMQEKRAQRISVRKREKVINIRETSRKKQNKFSLYKRWERHIEENEEQRETGTDQNGICRDKMKIFV